MGVWLGRWAPLIGSSLLAASVILPLFGQSELGLLLGNIAGTPGVGDASPVPAREIAEAVAQVAAAVAVAWGVIRKVIAVYKNPA